ncbi:unnamed protein product [Phytophthora fragariaefolia]|uniref:Unnamed protein product n=1 Tax=Phytophthora fragariaefolia TaxID=1490495 RepID=A0A9W7DDQ3_9STRA|nr:unnamed protein product [Phytophthora fragariaefolia]
MNSDASSRLTPHFPEQSAHYHASKKRRQEPDDDDMILSLAATNQNRDGLHNNRTRLSTTHKLRMMRTVVTAMEYELQGLQSKWTKQIPDARELAIAQRCALEKYTANQSNSVQRKLQELLQQQQILLASLQTAILRNSLHSSGRDIFKELHFDTRLEVFTNGD